jgi:hypothetical protein
MRKTIFLLLLTTLAAGAQKTAPAPIEKATASTVYRTPEVDSKPEIKEGMYTLPLFISKNFKLPDVHNKKLKLFVGFIIELDGTMSDVKFIYLDVKPLDESKVTDQTEEQKKQEAAQLEPMKAEAIRVVSAFKNRWKPAVKGGKPVRCQYNYPINFNLE